MKRDIPPYTKGQSLSLEITDLNHRGEGVGKAAGFTFFVAGALPGEKVKIEVAGVHKKHAVAKMLDLEQPSEFRELPSCPFFKRCGGCQLQHLSYGKQLAWKQKMVTETIRRITGIETPVLPIIGMENPWRYRNKAQVHFSFSGDLVKAGFFEQNSHRIIDIDDCPVQHPLNVEMLNAIRRAAQKLYESNTLSPGGEKLFSGASIRTSFAFACCLVSLVIPPGKIDMDSYKKLLDLINAETSTPPTGLALLQDSKKGSRCIPLTDQVYLEEKIGPYRYRISPQSFFQINPQQAGVLYEQAVSLSGQPHTAYDLYCGTGNFALYLSQAAEEVIGVDSERSAIEDARINATLNNTNNIQFINAKAEAIPTMLQKGRHPKTIFLNPPRAGCSSGLLKATASARPQKIVYISCNPATLARDLALLQKSGYTAQTIQPVDMFPHTSHVETVVLLERKDNIIKQSRI